MRVALAVPLVLVALAGCLGGGADDDAAVPSGPALLESGPPGSGAHGLPTNATALGPPIDPWGEETERVLFDGAVEDVRCVIAGTPGNPEAIDVACPFEGMLIPIGDAPFIPEGTGSLVVEADASSALKAGSYHYFLITQGRNTGTLWNEDRTPEPKHTWTVELTPADWDYEYRGVTVVETGFWASGEDGLNVLDGDIRVTITAQRDPAWAPRVPVDEFAPGGRHKVVAPGVVRLADANVTWAHQPGATLGFLGYPDDVPLAPIPAGTKQIAVGVTWTVRDCAPAHDCSPNPDLSRGWNYSLGEEAERGATHVVKLFEVPADFADDGPYAEEGSAAVGPFVWRCVRSVPLFGCFASFYATGATVEARVVAEAWNGDGDLAAFKARLGVA